MNRLPLRDRERILHMLVEGSSLKSIARVSKASLNTVTRLLSLAGEYCIGYHNSRVRNLRPKSVQLDEMWTYIYCRSQNVPHAKAAPAYAGDLWTWYAIDADTKLLISWLVGGHTQQEAEAFISDLHSRIAPDHRPQITTDGFLAYFWPIAKSFAHVDYGRAIKIPNSSGGLFAIKKEPVIGNPDLDSMHTNYVERYNKTVRMSVKRYTRQADAFSKSLEKHRHAVALQTVYYNYVRPHQTLRRNGLDVTPAMAAGLTGEPFTLEQLARSIPP